jgi:nucleoside-diphosphate kinase
MIERTLVLLKPDCVQRSFVGEIVQRFEKTGLKIVGMKMVWIDKKFAKDHYKEHVSKSFYPGLEALITLGPVVAFVLEGVHAIDFVRKLVGPTEPSKAAPGTIRGDFAHGHNKHADSIKGGLKNLIHASDSVESAKKEIALWFDKKELHTYPNVHDVHVLE